MMWPELHRKVLVHMADVLWEVKSGMAEGLMEGHCGGPLMDIKVQKAAIIVK
jgi:hypothetical protein